jgi:hypothetical protein
MGKPLLPWNPALASQPEVLRLRFQITAAKTVTPIIGDQPCLSTFDAIAAQTTIDNFLDTSSEFTIAKFDATAMGADAFGGVVDMGKQCRKVLGTAGATLVTRQVKASSALTDSTLETAVAKGADGNIAFKVDFGNTPDFDALTAGVIEIDIEWQPK